MSMSIHRGFCFAAALFISLTFTLSASRAQSPDRLLDRMDKNGDGLITESEWRGRAPFSRLDSDSNGAATRAEIVEFLKWRAGRRQGRRERVPRKAKLNHEFPSARFRAPNRETITLRSLRGRVVVLLPFATWCAPCVSKLPDYVRIYRYYQNSEKVSVIIYNYKDAYDTVDSHIRLNAAGDVRVMDAGVTGDQGATGWLTAESGRKIKLPGSMPQAWLIDRSGIVAQERTNRAGRSGFASAQRLCGDIERLARNMPVQSDWNKPIDYDWKKWSRC